MSLSSLSCRLSTARRFALTFLALGPLLQVGAAEAASLDRGAPHVSAAGAWDKVKSGVNKGVDKTQKGVKKGADRVKKGADKAVDKTKEGVDKGTDEVKKALD